MDLTIKHLQSEMDFYKQNQSQRKRDRQNTNSGFQMLPGGHSSNGGSREDESVTALRKKFEGMELPEETKEIVDKELTRLS